MARVRELRIVTRIQERYQAIIALHADGASIAAIARTLGVDRHTVRRFVRASGLEELQAKTLQRARLLDGYTDYLHQRWAQGCTDAAALTKERSPRWATAAVTRQCAGTCTRCATGDRVRRRGPQRRPSARSPDGSCDVRTVSHPTITCVSSRSWPTARNSTRPPPTSPRLPR